MKKLTKLILVGLLTVSSVNAKEILFDLRAQDFSNSQIDKQKMAKYKVSNKIIIENNINKSSKGFYYTGTNIDGIFTINVNTSLVNWKFNQDIKYNTYYGDRKRLITLTDKFGDSIILEFYQKGFTINGKEYKVDIHKEPLSISITKEANNLSVSINAQNVYSEIIKFDNLKSITTRISQNKYTYYDKLNNILLVSND